MLLLDVLPGMVIGLVASLVLVIYRSSRPHISSLGRVPGAPAAYADMTRHPESAPIPGVLIVRLDAPLYYANALTFRDQVKTLAEQRGDALRAVVFDAETQEELDVTSSEVLVGLIRGLQDKDLAVYLAEAHAPVIAWAKRTELYEMIGDAHVFPTVDAAARVGGRRVR